MAGADYLFDTQRTLSLLFEVYYNGFGTTETTHARCATLISNVNTVALEQSPCAS
ncbi:MAG: hypothetical protein JRH20_25250 [Deltaproteobacteria bacterium]|nr:hypothetical protein [Deltaproteobacteria bacterium]